MSALDFGDQIQSEKFSELKPPLAKCTNMTYIFQIECTQNMAFFLGKVLLRYFATMYREHFSYSCLMFSCHLQRIPDAPSLLIVIPWIQMIANDGVAFWDLPKSILSKRKPTKVFLNIIRHSNKNRRQNSSSDGWGSAPKNILKINNFYRLFMFFLFTVDCLLSKPLQVRAYMLYLTSRFFLKFFDTFKTDSKNLCK